MRQTVQSPRRRRKNRPLVVALYLNAALLAAVLAALVSRGNGLGSTAVAAGVPQGMPAIAGGSGLYMMPAQFSQFIWGCYVMDTDRQTLCAYEYIAGQKQLRLAAARSFKFDRELTSYNTLPSPEEIERLVQVQGAGIRGKEGPSVIPGVTPPGNAQEPKKPDSPDGPVVPKPSDINPPAPGEPVPPGSTPPEQLKIPTTPAPETPK